MARQVARVRAAIEPRRVSPRLAAACRLAIPKRSRLRRSPAVVGAVGKERNASGMANRHCSAPAREPVPAFGLGALYLGWLRSGDVGRAYKFAGLRLRFKGDIMPLAAMRDCDREEQNGDARPPASLSRTSGTVRAGESATSVARYRHSASCFTDSCIDICGGMQR